MSIPNQREAEIARVKKAVCEQVSGMIDRRLRGMTFFNGDKVIIEYRIELMMAGANDLTFMGKFDKLDPVSGVLLEDG